MCKKKRKTFFLVCAVLVVSVLAAACKKEQPVVQTEGVSAAQPLTEVNVEVFNRGTDGGRSDPTKNNYTDWIQEKILKEENIKVNFISIPRSDETSALN
ncbi:MAG: hypothetical protein LBR93_08540, partial [Treponema sp.]|nr:hypothetical protein [Treponema sp.]